MMSELISFEFTRPAMLIVALLVIPWLILGASRSLVDLPKWQCRLSLAVRGLMAMLLVFAVAGLVWMRTTDERFVVVAIDQSRSVSEGGNQFITDWIAKARAAAGPNRLLFLPFASEPGKISDQFAAVATEQAPQLASPSAGSSDMATNLEAAVESAKAAIPPNYIPEVVLLTDGNQTAGDVRRAASASGIRVSTVPLPDRELPEVQVAEVKVPSLVRHGEPFYLELAIDSTTPQPAQIDVFRDGLKVDSKRLDLDVGENRFRLRQQVTDERQVQFSVRVSAANDTFLDNNQASGLVTATGKPRVLLIDSDPRTIDTLRWALEEQAVRVDLRPPPGFPDSLTELQAYDAVVLSNVPATELSLRSLQDLRSYVRDLGGGLVVIGGDQAFGLGGYYRTPLEEILPVRSDFEKEKEKPSLAMVLIIDRSGSMGGTKLELAKDAARGAVELLGPRDQIGVIAFDNETYWVSELHSAADKEYVINRISMLANGGGTNMYPAMVDAFRALQTAVAKLKHVVILTDGISSPGDFTGVTADMVAQRITVSTVAVGDGADEKLLEAIAEMGGGRYYLCDDPQSVPQIFAKETMAASRSAINELPFLPQQLRSTRVLDGIDFDNAPPLLGFVATRPKPTSEVVLSTEQGEPLLAWWRYGLGMTMAFTSDAKSRWASEWMAWPDFPAFWAQLVRSVMRNRKTEQGELRIRYRDDAIAVTLDVVDSNGRFQNQATTWLTLLRPGDEVEKKEFIVPQTAPGQYTIRLPISEAGAYFLDVTQTKDDQVVFQQAQGLHVGYPAELRLKPSDRQLLRQVAESTGGAFNPTPEQLFQSARPPVSRAEALWPLLLSMSLILLLVDIALRRVDFSAWLLPRRQIGDLSR